MERKQWKKDLRKRIQSGNVMRKDVAIMLAQLAFGEANDCVKLVLEEETNLDGLDLSLLAEIKRTDKGKVEIKLIDRLQVLQQLAALMEQEECGMDKFLQDLQGGGEG